MEHIDPARPSQSLPLHGSANTRLMEQAAMAQLPAHELMRRAALSVHRLGLALYPHARHVWVACGPGNNGGDGLWTAALWQSACAVSGTRVTVGWLGDEQRLPDDARFALQQARLAGVNFADHPPADADLCIDALLGLGVHSPPTGRMADWIGHLQTTAAPVVCVDLPSGLNPDSGHWHPDSPCLPKGPRHTLCLLTLKPGLFTGPGREAAGDLWFDDLGVCLCDPPPLAWLHGASSPRPLRRQRHHAHKGSHGDLLVLGGQDVNFNGQGMTGAALLAARAGLCSGAGRVYVGLLGGGAPHGTAVDTLCPELMFRAPDSLLQAQTLAGATTVCGCGGGAAVRQVLPAVLAHSARLVLDADGLNALAGQAEWQEAMRLRSQRGQVSVITPHPTEAARLLQRSTADVQGDRLAAAQALAQRFQCTAVLKGAGSVVATPERQPVVHGAGNALLATAGTGDVLAGMIGAHLCLHGHSPEAAFQATNDAVHRHGLAADGWPAHRPFGASAILSVLTPA